MPPRRAVGAGRRGRGRPPLARTTPIEDPTHEQGVGMEDEVPPVDPQPQPPPPPAQPQVAVPAMDPTAFMQQLLALQAQTLQILQTMEQTPPPTPAAVAPEPARPVPQVDYVDLGTRHRPPMFAGGSDPGVFDDWEYHIGRIFQHIGCPDDRKILVATQYLTGAALHWWRANETRLLGREGFGWTQFREALRSHFYTPQMMSAKRREFLGLVQLEDQSVTDYHRRFTELSRFATELIPTEAERVRRFIDGLKAEIRAGYGYLDHATLSSAYDQALFVERGRADERRLWQSRKREREGRQARDQRGGQRPRAVGRGGGQIGGRGQGGEGQPRAPGYNDPRRCWNCQELGHVRRHCPRPQQGGPQQQQHPRAVVPVQQVRPIQAGRGGRLNVIERADVDRRDDVMAGNSF